MHIIGMKFQTKGDPGVSAFPDGDNLFKWIATLTGPQGTVRYWSENCYGNLKKNKTKKPGFFGAFKVSHIRWQLHYKIEYEFILS